MRLICSIINTLAKFKDVQNILNLTSYFSNLKSKNLLKHYYLFLFLLFISCNKESNIDLPDYSSKIVVDGWIEKDGFANVLLTKSAPYLGSVDSVSIRELILTRAKVSLSDGADTEILTMRPNFNYFPPYVYYSTRIKGEEGKTYFLKVEYAGQIVTAETSIPKSPQVLDVWFENTDGEKEEGIIWANLNNSPQEDSYYRIFTKIKSENKRYIPIKLPNYSSKDFNKTNINIPLYKGNTNTSDTTSNVFYNQSDTVLVKISTTSKSAYDYWENFQQEILNSKNPFATSSKTLESNLNGNALGIWCGYNSAIYTVINPTAK